jgi:intein/homing endonuclease
MSQNIFYPVTQRFTLSESTINEIKSMTPEFGFNGLGEVVFRRTYSRDNESWNDVVIRVVKGTFSIRKEHYLRNSLEWRDEMWQEYARNFAVSLFKMEWMPPGRGLWMMGTDFCYNRGSISLYNCAATDTTKDLVLSAEWTMDCLMNGVGVGFSTNWRGIATMPNKNDTQLFVVPDSREGWVDSLIMLMCSYVDSPRHGKCKFPKFDYSQIRPRGELIKGFGGLASGPEPLIKLHNRVEGFLDAFCVGYLSIESGEGEARKRVKKEYNHTRLVADIFNSIGACVVAGNVRRCLPKGSLVHCKDGLIPIENVKVGDMVQTFTGYEKVKSSFTQGVQKLVKIVTEDGYFECTPNHKMPVLTSTTEYEWKNASDLKENDRLVVTRESIKGKETFLPECEGLTIPKLDAGLCWLLGTIGFREIDIDSNILAYTETIETARTLCFELCKFGKDLKITITREEINDEEMGSVYFFNIKCDSKYLLQYFKNINQNGVPKFILESTRENKLAYASGFRVSFNGYINMHTSAEIFHSNNESVCKDFQSLLYSCGITSRLKKSKYGGSYILNLVDRYSKILFSKIPELNKDNENIINYKSFMNEEIKGSNFLPMRVLEVVESREEETFDIEVENRHEFFCNGYLTHNSAEIALGGVNDSTFINLKNYELNPERGEIGWMSNNSVVLTADHDYQDFTNISEFADCIRINGEPGMINLHNIQNYGRYGKASRDEATLVNPCGEISLEDKETCNLAEVFPPRCESPQVFYEALRFATFYASTVSLLPTHRPETNQVISRNRRIGVSISGIAQWANSQFVTVKGEAWGKMNYTRMTSFLRNAYKEVKNENVRLAISAGVPPSIRVTTIKPSGSISLLAGVTPGVHYPVSRYAIRRMRIGTNSPLVKYLQEANISSEMDKWSENTLVFSFAIDHGDVRPSTEVSPWEQFSIVAMLQRCYADNCVSATVYFDKEKDGPDVEKMLAMYIPILKSVSMLPHSGHGYEQAPYEPITKEQYEVLKSSYSMPKFASYSGNVPEGSKYCSGDTCEL